MPESATLPGDETMAETEEDTQPATCDEWWTALLKERREQGATASPVDWLTLRRLVAEGATPAIFEELLEAAEGGAAAAAAYRNAQTWKFSWRSMLLHAVSMKTHVQGEASSSATDAANFVYAERSRHTCQPFD